MYLSPRRGSEKEVWMICSGGNGGSSGTGSDIRGRGFGDGDKYQKWDISLSEARRLEAQICVGGGGGGGGGRV